MINAQGNDISVCTIGRIEAERFLVSHSPLANADLLGQIADNASTIAFLGLYGPSGLAAVAGVRTTTPYSVFDHVVFIECLSPEQLSLLLKSVPPGRLYVKIHNDTVADWLTASVGVQAEQLYVWFSVNRQGFMPQTPHEGRVLSRMDVPRFPSPRPPAAAHFYSDRSNEIVWGIERSGQIVSSAVGASVARTSAGGIGAIADLHTDENWRGGGLATRVISAMTEALLVNNEHVLYWTAPDNAASQRVASKLGYVQNHQVHEFLIHDAWSLQECLLHPVHARTRN